MLDISQLRARIARLGVRQGEVAHLSGIEESRFSRILRGRRPAPPDFEARVQATLDRLEAAEQAAEEARERVLADSEPQ